MGRRARILSSNTRDAQRRAIALGVSWSPEYRSVANRYDPRLVPGVLFCNRPIDRDDPALIDIAPTALRQFGIEPPAFMDGRPLFEEPGDRSRSQPAVTLDAGNDGGGS